MRHSEQEEVLRRALHAVADAIEPAPDGLERIRERLSRPHPLVVAWAMAAWTGMVQALRLRLEPDAEGQPGRLGSLLRQVARYLEVAGERLRPAVEALLGAARALRPGSGMSRHEKLRSALAFGAAAVIGAAGGFALSAGLPQQVISAALSTSPNQPHHSANGGRDGGRSNGSGQNLPTSGTTAGGTRKAGASPSASCKPTPPASASSLPSIISSSTPAPSTNPPTSPPTPTPPSSPTTSPATTSSSPTATPTQSSGATGPSTAPNQSTDGTPNPTPNPTPNATDSSSASTNRIDVGAHPATSPRAKHPSPC